MKPLYPVHAKLQMKTKVVSEELNSIYFGHNCCNTLIQLYMVRVDFSAFCAVVLLGYISHLVIVLKNIVFIVHMT